jgi:hypothetical protein
MTWGILTDAPEDATHGALLYNPAANYELAINISFSLETHILALATDDLSVIDPQISSGAAGNSANSAVDVIEAYLHSRSGVPNLSDFAITSDPSTQPFDDFMFKGDLSIMETQNLRPAQ